MGFFSNDDGKDAIKKAAEAVKKGYATERQKQLNEQAAKQAGAAGDRARDAYK